MKRNNGGSSVEDFPWADFMQIGLGKMQMRPDDFWNMSLVEFYAALEGFAEFNSGGAPPPLRKDELEDLMERYPD